MTVSEFADTNSLMVLCIPDGNRVISGGYTGDLLSWVMGRAKADDAWITIMSNTNTVAVAQLVDVACIIFAEGVIPQPEVVQTAEKNGINMLSTTHDSFAAAVMLSESLK